jgi:AcrR family transcriptional regulator
METSSNRQQKTREQRRRQILETAFEIFSKKGYNATKVSDIAERAGVSQGTIYWYFDSKEDLLTQSLLSFFDQMSQGMIESLEQFPSATQKLRSLADILDSFIKSAEGLFIIFLEFWASSSQREQVGKIWTDILVQYKDFLSNIIHEGIQNGEFKPVDADGLVWAVMATYDGLAAYDMFIQGLNISNISRTFIDTILDGLLIDNPGEDDDITDK